MPHSHVILRFGLLQDFLERPMGNVFVVYLARGCTRQELLVRRNSLTTFKSSSLQGRPGSCRRL